MRTICNQDWFAIKYKNQLTNENIFMFFSKPFFLVLSTVVSASLLTSCSDKKQVANDYWQQYEVLATQIVNDAGTASFNHLAKSSEKLTELSMKILPEFVNKQPICETYVNAVIAAQPVMLTLSLDDIERDYHADGKLPEIKDVSCYHAKDLLVHPATAVVISKTLIETPESREQLKHEMEEVLEHFNQVKISAGL